MHPTGSGYTDRGKKRDHNEDSFLVDDGLGLYIVSDGMGGHAAATSLALLLRLFLEDMAGAVEEPRRS
jgi:serine/threonine protein phosphatase PrpC